MKDKKKKYIEQIIRNREKNPEPARRFYFHLFNANASYMDIFGAFKKYDPTIDIADFDHFCYEIDMMDLEEGET